MIVKMRERALVSNTKEGYNTYHGARVVASMGRIGFGLLGCSKSVAVVSLSRGRKATKKQV